MSIFRIRSKITGKYHRGGYVTNLNSERYSFTTAGKIWSTKSALSLFFAQYRHYNTDHSDPNFYLIPELLDKTHWEVIEYFDDTVPTTTPFVEFFKNHIKSSKYYRSLAKKHGINLTELVDSYHGE